MNNIELKKLHDKIYGKISNKFWLAKTKTWSTEKEILTIKLLATQKADIHHLENADFILELSKMHTRCSNPVQ